MEEEANERRRGMRACCRHSVHNALIDGEDVRVANMMDAKTTQKLRRESLAGKRHGRLFHYALSI